MASRQGLNRIISATSPIVNEPLYSLTGLADNTILADQIICVAKKWLERECLTPSINQRNDIKDSDCAAEIHSIYNQIPWRTRQGTLKTNYDNIGINYQDGIFRDFCAMFVYVVWYQATYCLGGVDGNEDMYLFKSSRVYDDTFSMRLGTMASGKTKIDRVPTPGSAFVRRRDNLNPTSGHAGIVVDVQEGQFTCIEGNGAQTAQTGQPFEMRTYTDSDIVKYAMYFLHIEDTPVINAAYPREDGYCCAIEQRKEEKVGPCTNAQKPAGEGWTATDPAIFQSIIGGGDPIQNAKYYTDQQLEFSPEWCWVRTKPKTSTTTTEAIERRTGNSINTPCPDVKPQNCVQAVRVSASTFNAKSVPHFSVLYRNRLMGADITGSKWTFQTVGPRNGEGLGSALALPAPKFSSVDGDAIPGTAYSGFGTFSDVNGNLIVIVPEWMSARLNSLIGSPKDNVPSLLGSQGFYQVNCPAYTGGGGVHAQAIDANYIVGSIDVVDGISPVRATTNSNSLVGYKTDRYGSLEKDKYGFYIRDRWVDENLFPGGVKLPFDLSWNSVVSNSNDFTGLLNQIELNQDKNPRGMLSKPILIVLKSAPPPFDWIQFAKEVITIAASFAPMVGIPSQVFTTALQAVNTVESLALGKADVLSSVVRIAGLVTSLLPKELRGEIESLIKDVAGETIVTAVNDSKQYLQNATNFLTDIKNTPTKAFQALGFSATSATVMQTKIFGALLPTIENFKPNWYDFASDYSKNLNGDFDKGFQDGVKLLHSMETIKSTQQFGRYTASGATITDIIRGGSSLGIPEFQNLMITGLAGTVMSSTPGITKVMAAIMHQTRDILVNGSDTIGISKGANISEIAGVLKVGNGFMADPTDFERLTLQSLMMRVSSLAEKGVTKFVLPPSLTPQQQECWGKELALCHGIEIVGSKETYKKESKSTEILPPVKVPPCIQTVNGSFMYCPPVTCKTGLSDEYNPSAKYELRCTDWLARENVPGSWEKQVAAIQILNAGEKVAGFSDASGIYTRKYNGVLYQFGADDQGILTPQYPAIDVATGKPITNINGFLCELVEVPIVAPKVTITPKVATTVESSTPQTSQQPCAVMYPARVSPGVPDRWFAQIAGQWVEIIDCCPGVLPMQAKDCCDETQLKLNQMKLDLAKVIELVGRNQAGEKCPECDLSEIKRMITGIQFPPQKTYDDAPLREEMRQGFAEMRAMIGQMKQYDVSKDLNEIKDLIKSIKVADCQAIADEVKILKKLIEVHVGEKTVAAPQDTKYFDSKYNELKELINSKNIIYQKDYSGELAQIQRDLDYFKTEFAKTKSTITTEIATTTNTQEKQNLEKLLVEQNDLFTKKIKDLEVKLTKPCEECTEIAKLQSQMKEMRELILAIKPGTNTTTIKEVSNPSDKGEIDRLRKELDTIRIRYDEMYEGFTSEIDRLRLVKQDSTDLEQMKEEQIDNYNIYIINLEKKIKELEAKQTASVPPVSKPETPIIKNGECTNCPKVVESHTRTIYEYPPVQPSQDCEDEDC